MSKLLKDISKISTGLYAKSQPNGSVYCLQGRDFDSYKQLNTNIEPSINADSNIYKHLLQQDDVIIAAKGFDYFAFTFKNEVRPAVASSMFIVLKNIDTNEILPDYITWYLNHPKIQNYLNASAKGTSIQSINKSIIEQIEIPIPSIRKQQLIIDTAHLAREQKILEAQVKHLKENLINQQLLKAITQ